MKRRMFERVALTGAAIMLAVSAGLATGCSSEVSESEGDPIASRSDTSQGVAATVNGSPIGERSVTAFIEYRRAIEGLEDDHDWAEWLDVEGLTPESYRESIIEDYIDLELLRQGAEDLGVEVSEDEIDEYITEEWGEMTDEEWQKNLDRLGITDERYRDMAKNALLRSKVAEAISPDGSLTWSQYIEELRDDADISIKEMPSGLSYDVDMSEFAGDDVDAE